MAKEPNNYGARILKASSINCRPQAIQHCLESIKSIHNKTHSFSEFYSFYFLTFQLRNILMNLADSHGWGNQNDTIATNEQHRNASGLCRINLFKSFKMKEEKK